MKLNDSIPSLHANGKWVYGREVRREELIGNPTLIYFWSISCDTCKKALLHLQEFRHDNRRKLNVISIHTPLTKDDNNLTEIRKIANDFDIHEPLFADLEDELSIEFKVRHVPSYFIFDDEGKLRHQQSGNGGIEMLKRRLERVLK